tara:strand:+ start:277340 stop:277474 length:135 start_codon:yes stop_codon:yes gene_type:complete
MAKKETAALAKQINPKILFIGMLARIGISFMPFQPSGVASPPNV